MEDSIAVNEIYGDLPAVAAEAEASRADKEVELEMARKKISELEAQVAKLSNEARVWAKQRSVLVHNMSMLLKTAKLEVSRKDKEIGRLRQQLDGRNEERVQRSAAIVAER